MGTTTKKDNARYLQIFQGEIIEPIKKDKIDPERKDFRTRTNKDGKEVYEYFHPGVIGYITDIKFKPKPEDNPQFKDQWEIHLMDNEEGGLPMILTFGFDSGYAIGFLNAIKNVDISKPIEIIPNSQVHPTIPNRTKTTVFLKEDGMSQAAKWYFTRDNPRDLPPLEQVTFKGVPVWDNTQQMAYFRNMIENDIVPAVKAVKSRPQITVAPQHTRQEFENKRASIQEAMQEDEPTPFYPPAMPPDIKTFTTDPSDDLPF